MPPYTPPSKPAKFVIVVSILVSMGVVGFLGFLFVAESFRDSANLAVDDWIITALVALCVLAGERFLLKNLIAILRNQPPPRS